MAALGALDAEGGPSQAAAAAEQESEPDTAELLLFKAHILQMLKPDETVLGALRRLSEVGVAAVPGQANVGSLEARRAQHLRMKTGRTVPPENRCTNFQSSMLLIAIHIYIKQIAYRKASHLLAIDHYEGTPTFPLDTLLPRCHLTLP